MVESGGLLDLGAHSEECVRLDTEIKGGLLKDLSPRDGIQERKQLKGEISGLHCF